jgi:hypothetical protein
LTFAVVVLRVCPSRPSLPCSCRLRSHSQIDRGSNPPPQRHQRPANLPSSLGGIRFARGAGRGARRGTAARRDGTATLPAKSRVTRATLPSYNPTPPRNPSRPCSPPCPTRSRPCSTRHAFSLVAHRVDLGPERGGGEFERRGRVEQGRERPGPLLPRLHALLCLPTIPRRRAIHLGPVHHPVRLREGLGEERGEVRRRGGMGQQRFRRSRELERRSLRCTPRRRTSPRSSPSPSRKSNPSQRRSPPNPPPSTRTSCCRRRRWIVP